jgi:hypothetical protein
MVERGSTSKVGYEGGGGRRLVFLVLAIFWLEDFEDFCVFLG